MRVNDGEPGDECEVDYGRLGIVFDSAAGRRRVCHALVLTACVSRHCFVWLSFTHTTAAVIEGFGAAWAFFGGGRTVIGGLLLLLQLWPRGSPHVFVRDRGEAVAALAVTSNGPGRSRRRFPEE